MDHNKIKEVFPSPAKKATLLMYILLKINMQYNKFIHLPSLSVHLDKSQYGVTAQR